MLNLFQHPSENRHRPRRKWTLKQVQGDGVGSITASTVPSLTESPIAGMTTSTVVALIDPSAQRTQPRRLPVVAPVVPPGYVVWPMYPPFQLPVPVIRIVPAPLLSLMVAQQIMHAKFDAVEIEQGCTTGQALDILVASTTPATP